MHSDSEVRPFSGPTRPVPESRPLLTRRWGDTGRAPMVILRLLFPSTSGSEPGRPLSFPCYTPSSLHRESVPVCYRGIPFVCLGGAGGTRPPETTSSVRSVDLWPSKHRSFYPGDSTPTLSSSSSHSSRVVPGVLPETVLLCLGAHVGLS